MKDAYTNHSLTEEEVLNLTAYLKSVSQNRYYQNARDYSLLFVFSGIFVFVAVFLATIILYFRRKRGTVHEAIFSRQTQEVHS
jgi:heme/copper-type cytochrome/quinol oxidase subunit 2